MGYSQRTPLEKLASDFGTFIENPRTLGGGYKVTTGGNYFFYQIGKFVVDGNFPDEDNCRVKIANGSTIEDTLEVSYIHTTEPDFLKLFTDICVLAKKLNN